MNDYFRHSSNDNPSFCDTPSARRAMGYAECRKRRRRPYGSILAIFGGIPAAGFFIVLGIIKWFEIWQGWMN